MFDPDHGRDRQGRHRRPHDVPGVALRGLRGPHEAGDRHDRGGAPRAAALARRPGQAARGRAPADADDVRPRDAPRGRVLQRDRELLAAHRRPRPGHRAVHAARLLPRRLPGRARRVARHRAAAPRDVRGRRLPQEHARRLRVPAALARSTTGRCGSTSSRSACQQVVYMSRDPEPLRAPRVVDGGRADRPAHRADRSRGRDPARRRARSTT